jgi:agmatine/peptidylarginine deiminase
MKLSALALVVAAGFVALPASAEWDVQGTEELIPHHETELEVERLRASGRSPSRGLGRAADPPPVGPIRNCGEWEPVTGVMVRYPFGLPSSLLVDVHDHVYLHVVVQPGSKAAARNYLLSVGVDTAQVQFLVQPNNSIWVRDYGPWFVFDGNGDLGIVDHVYNRPFRPDDDQIPVYFGTQQGIPVYRHDMWHTGGNYMTDGSLFSMSTDLVYNEAASANGMSPGEVDSLMEAYYGIDSYNVVTDIESGGIHHIDTWGKFLDEETVLVKEVWSSHYTYSNLEQRATLIGSLVASTGRNYQVHRVYCQPISGGQPASYTKSLFVNDLIMVPTFNSATNDSNALDVYRAAMPGYDVRGYWHSGWITDDALHCRAKGIMDRHMLRVSHVPIVEEQVGAVPVTALVDDRSEAGLTYVDLHYRHDGGSWQTVAMVNVAGDDWAGTIPAPPTDGIVDYYVLAGDATGREEGSPRVAPGHWHSFPALAGATSAGIVAAGLETAAFPNPFRDRTSFRFELKYPESVRLSVYDVSGRLVRRLVDGERPAGSTEIVWDARDDGGRPVPSGVYFFRLRAAGIHHARPVVLTK